MDIDPLAPPGPSPLGPTVILGSGTYFSYSEPWASVPTLEDLAYGHAYECRFNGQCRSRRTGRRVFYSVAQHCVLMSHVVAPAIAYDALMHEAEEFICKDLSTDLKRMSPDYKAIARRCQAALFVRFAVPMLDPDAIKAADLRMLATERRDILNWNGERWGIDGKATPYDIEIEPWEHEEAARAFIARFREIAPDTVREME